MLSDFCRFFVYFAKAAHCFIVHTIGIKYSVINACFAEVAFGAVLYTPSHAL